MRCSNVEVSAGKIDDARDRSALQGRLHRLAVDRRPARPVGAGEVGLRPTDLLLEDRAAPGGAELVEPGGEGLAPMETRA